MKPFLFSKGQKHYARFFVPTALQEQFGKKYLVFALGSGAGHEIRLKAHHLEHELTNHCNKLLQNAGMNFPISKLDLVFPTGLAIRNINNDDDMRRANKLIAQLHALKALQAEAPPQTAPVPAPVPAPAPAPAQEQGLKLMGLVDKYFLLKSHLLPATAQSYKNCCQEFQDFLKNPNITSIMSSDVSRFQEHLAKNKNSVRTIENKIGLLSSLFNFAIKQSHYFAENPAQGRALLTKKQRIARGYETFELEEIKQIFTAEEFTREKERDPDFYYLCILGLVTGCRVGELSSLKKSDFKKTPTGTDYLTIRVAKTLAGVRSVPFHSGILELGLQEFIDSKSDSVFKYTDREGKGAGNASGKKFSRLLETLKLKREKLVFHSLRKFFNDYLLKKDVPYEPRCQYIGHEIGDTNVSTYTKQFSEDELLRYVEKSQEDILIACNLTLKK